MGNGCIDNNKNVDKEHILHHSNIIFNHFT